MAVPHSLVTTNHGVGQSRASAGLAGLSITACCTSTQWLWEGKAWCPFVTCLLAHRAENPSSHQAVDWCFSQLPTIRWRQMPETPVSGILRTPTTWRFNTWLPPRVCWQPDVSFCNIGAQYKPQLTTKKTLLTSWSILPSPGGTVQCWCLTVPLLEKMSFASSDTKQFGSGCPVTHPTELSRAGLVFPNRVTLGCNRRNEGPHGLRASAVPALRALLHVVDPCSY